jgi:hypothetical protein
LPEVDLSREEAARQITNTSKREDEHAPGSQLESVSARRFSRTLPELVHIFLGAALGVPLLLADWKPT